MSEPIRPAAAHTYVEMQRLELLRERARANRPGVVGSVYAGAVADVLDWLAGAEPTPTLSILLELPRPEPAAPPVRIHHERDAILARFQQADLFVIHLSGGDTAWDPETGDRLLGPATITYARGEFPGPALTATVS